MPKCWYDLWKNSIKSIELDYVKKIGILEKQVESWTIQN